MSCVITDGYQQHILVTNSLQSKCESLNRDAFDGGSAKIKTEIIKTFDGKMTKNQIFKNLFGKFSTFPENLP